MRANTGFDLFEFPGRAPGFSTKEFSAYRAWQERMMQRPTVKKSVESEEKVSAQ